MYCNKRIGWLAALSLVVCLGSAGTARAEMAYTQMGGGGGLSEPNHIDFSIAFNMQTGESVVKDGFGFWLGYRRSLNEAFSIGAKVGYHSFKVEIDSLSSQDTVTVVPILLTGQVDHAINRQIRVFGQIGLGVSINNDAGDLADTIDFKLDPGFAVDLSGGVVFAATPNFDIGLVVDWFISNPTVSSSITLDSTTDIGHVGIGLQCVGSF